MSGKSWPHTDNHFDFLDKMEEILENSEKPLPKSKISEKARSGEEGLDISDHTIKRWLSQYRQVIESHGFDTEERDDGSPGHLAVYWRLDEE